MNFPYNQPPLEWRSVPKDNLFDDADFPAEIKCFSVVGSDHWMVQEYKQGEPHPRNYLLLENEEYAKEYVKYLKRQPNTFSWERQREWDIARGQGYWYG